MTWLSSTSITLDGASAWPKNKSDVMSEIWENKKINARENQKDTHGLREMISVGKVLKLIPVSRSTLHRMVREKRFPQSHELSPMRIEFSWTKLSRGKRNSRIRTNDPSQQTLGAARTIRTSNSCEAFR